MIRLLAPHLVHIALAVAVAAVGTAGVTAYQLQSARHDLQAAERREAGAVETIERLRETLAVLRVHRQRLADITRDHQAILDDLNEMEGGDALSSDYLRTAAERVFGAD